MFRPINQSWTSTNTQKW